MADSPERPLSKPNAPKPAGKPLAGMGLDHGMSQVSLVETALSPLDFQPGTALRHMSEFVYYDADRQRRTGVVTVKAPGGLSPTDELILYGLLAVTFADTKPVAELTATPHFLCRQLGLPIGGDHYKRLRESLHRLSEVIYRNSAWWDRQRSQHRDVGFHFLSHDLPATSESRGDDHGREPWTIWWDPLFFRLMDSSRGFVWFDFPTYRALKNPAARRGFLLLQKIFHHRDVTPRFDMQAFATQQLGYAAGLEAKSVRQKLKALIAAWQEQGIVDPAADPESFFARQGPGRWTLTLKRGPRFDAPAPRPRITTGRTVDHPSYEILKNLDLTHDEIQSIQESHRDSLVYVIRTAQLAQVVHRQGKSGETPKRIFRDMLEKLRATGEDPTTDTERQRSIEIYERRKQDAEREWTRRTTETGDATESEIEGNSLAGEIFQRTFVFPDFETWIAGDDSGL
jgi:hypothetical protein